MKSMRDGLDLWSGSDPPEVPPASRHSLSPLLAHFRRLARDVRHDVWPTSELAVLRRLESRARREPRRTPGQIHVPPYRFDYIDALSTWPQWDDIFIHQSLDFACEVAEPRILDCGANIGLASLYFKRRYPHARVTAFEPDPRLAAICRSNLAFSDVVRHVDVKESAVWTTDGTLEFICEGTDSGAIASLDQNVEGPVAPVSSVRLRDWLDEPVDLLKLDIEGAEVPVLRDCSDRLANVRAMLIDLHEFNPDRRQTGSLFDLLVSARFLFDVRDVTPLPWRSAGAASPFKNPSLTWVATVRAWRR